MSVFFFYLLSLSCRLFYLDSSDLMAVPVASSSSIPPQWVDLMSTLKRSASTTLEAFLLPSDDPKTHQARKLLAKARSQKIIKRAPTPWAKCESRHYRARHEEELGPLRPYTFWPDGGGDPKFPDGSWKDWGPSQTERVWDLTDISYLRMAKTGSDVCMLCNLHSYRRKCTDYLR